MLEHKEFIEKIQKSYDVIITDIYKSKFNPSDILIIIQFNDDMVCIPEYKLGEVDTINFKNKMVILRMPIHKFNEHKFNQ